VPRLFGSKFFSFTLLSILPKCLNQGRFRVPEVEGSGAQRGRNLRTLRTKLRASPPNVRIEAIEEDMDIRRK
jgi:hypothetical protein